MLTASQRRDSQGTALVLVRQTLPFARMVSRSGKTTWPHQTAGIPDLPIILLVSPDPINALPGRHFNRLNEQPPPRFPIVGSR